MADQPGLFDVEGLPVSEELAEEFRVAPDGDVVAYCRDGDSYLVGTDDRRGGQEAALAHLHATKADLEHPFSDVVVYGGA